MHVDLRTVAVNVLVDEAVVCVPMRVHDAIVGCGPACVGV